MPKVYKIGKTRFTQFIKFPVKWGWKITVRGWTQEIEEPFRTATPVILRMPFHKAVVFGKWTGAQPDEESALNNAMQGLESEWLIAKRRRAKHQCLVHKLVVVSAVPKKLR